MNSAYIYLQIYRLFDSVTPIKADCGELCSGACCEGDDTGMYLFPGEKKVYDLLEPDWVSTDKTDFTYTFNGKKKHLNIAFCKGSCDRYQRPLACRIFPLTPILSDEGKLEVIVDPRAKSLCPLAKAFNLDDFEPQFVRNVKKAFIMLSKNKEFMCFLKEYTEYIKDFQKFI